MNVYEMEGFLRGKCLPSDLKVNESNAEYLVRKLNAVSELKAELTAALATIEKCREIVGCPAGMDLQDHLRQLAAENVGLNKFIKQSCYVYNGDGSDISDSYIPAHESPMMPEQKHPLLPVTAECLAIRDAFISYLTSENLANNPDANEQQVYDHCAKWVDAMCETPRHRRLHGRD
ncbi:hypothetical protein RRQ98_005219 [Klebsiella pneumoniae]|nr:hypothetical protein [Klebsiella pneumoniae]